MTTQRELTDREKRIVDLCRIFERSIDRGRLTISFWANEKAVKALQFAELADSNFRVLSYHFDGERGEYRVTWGVRDFHTYLNWLIEKVGMKLQTDGSLVTKDGLTITTEYLQ